MILEEKSSDFYHCQRTRNWIWAKGSLRSTSSIGQVGVSNMCPYQHPSCMVCALPLKPEAPWGLYLLVTDFSGRSGRWRGKIESSIPSQVHEEPAGRPWAAGQEPLPKEAMATQPSFEMGDWLSFLCLLFVFFCPRTVSAAAVAIGCCSPDRQG